MRSMREEPQIGQYADILPRGMDELWVFNKEGGAAEGEDDDVVFIHTCTACMQNLKHLDGRLSNSWNYILCSQ